MSARPTAAQLRKASADLDKWAKRDGHRRRVAIPHVSHVWHTDDTAATWYRAVFELALEAVEQRKAVGREV